MVVVTAQRLGPPNFGSIVILKCRSCQDEYETGVNERAHYIADWVHYHNDEGHIKRNAHTAHLYANSEA